jgi:hypothetical protein
MRKLLLALLLCAAPAGAQPINQYVGVGIYPFLALGYCQLTSLSTAVGLASCSGGIPTSSDIVQVCAETQAIRYRDDGTNPTATVGMPVASGTCFQYSGSSLSALKFIEQTASAKLNISFYK